MSWYPHHSAAQDTNMFNDPYFNWQQHPAGWNNILATPPSSRFPRRTPPSLPEEILEHIVRLIAIPCSFSQEEKPFSPISISNPGNLFTLSLVSKALNRITEPHLYKTYKTSSSQPSLFLAALHARPHRFQFVRELHIARTSSTTYSPDPCNVSANLHMLEMDRQVSVLLRCPFPKLEVLDIALCEEYHGSQTQRVVKGLGSRFYTGPVRGTLKRVMFRSCGLRTCKVVPAMNLLLEEFPYVEEKTFKGLDLFSTLNRIQEQRQEAAEQMIALPQVPVQDSVKSLHISECCLENGRLLDILLETWPKLTSLDLTWDACALDASSISRAILQICPLLERLRIDSRRQRQQYPGGGGDGGGGGGNTCRGNKNASVSAAHHQQQLPPLPTAQSSFGSFAGLQQLQHLKYLAMSPWDLLREDRIWGQEAYQSVGSIVECLPDGLQHLVILRRAGWGIPVEEVEQEDRLVRDVLCSVRVMGVRKVEVE